jgi:hypothetical protein
MPEAQHPGPHRPCGHPWNDRNQFDVALPCPWLVENQTCDGDYYSGMKLPIEDTATGKKLVLTFQREINTFDMGEGRIIGAYRWVLVRTEPVPREAA